MTTPAPTPEEVEALIARLEQNPISDREALGLIHPAAAMLRRLAALTVPPRGSAEEAVACFIDWLETMERIYEKAPGLPLELEMSNSDLEKWTNALTSIGMNLGLARHYIDNNYALSDDARNPYAPKARQLTGSSMTPDDTELCMALRFVPKCADLPMCAKAAARIEALNAQAATMQFSWRQVQPALDATRERLADAEAELARLRPDAERLQKILQWLDGNTTFYDVDADWPVEGPNIPTLAQVSNRIWYHATDDMTTFPFSAAIDAALSQPAQERK